MKVIATIVILWLFCGYVAAGANHAYFTNNPTGKYLYEHGYKNLPREDAWKCAILVPLGPISLAAIAATSGGFMYGITWDWPRYLFLPLVEGSK